MQPTQQQIIQDQIAEKAKHAAMVASATGKVAGNAFLSAIKGAETAGEKAVVIGALVGIVAFFLPWVRIFGLSGSGFRVATDASALFWLHPISMLACFLMSLSTRGEGPRQRILAARWYILIGAVWFTPGAALLTNILSGVVGPGGYLATASAAAILVGGFLQISERLPEPASPSDGNSGEPQ